MTNNETYQREPAWHVAAQLTHAQVDEQQAGWLFDKGSLTARLVARCGGRFHVRVVSQTWQRPLRNEAQRLGIKPHRLALIRQVYLYCDDIPWVFARTVIPHKTLTGKQKFLAHLGSRPLGAVLFADPHMRRDEIEVTCLRTGERMYRDAVAMLPQPPDCVWGRRSVFYLNNKPLLVNEIFLPGVTDQADTTRHNTQI